MNHKEYIKALIGVDELREAINEFQRGVMWHKQKGIEVSSHSRLANNLLLLSARYNGNERSNRMGVLSGDKYAIAKARIRVALLSYLKKYWVSEQYSFTIKQGLIGGFDNLENDDEPVVKPTRKPGLFFAFSNHIDRKYLPTLTKERKEIEKALRSLEIQNIIQRITQTEVTITDIFDVFLDWKGHINLFHYAGHAHPDGLMLNDQTAFIEGLIERIVEENEDGNVVLVFLNGCSTNKHVQVLLEGGVKAVIATSANVNDTLATEFAIRFYKNLAKNEDILGAYNNASALINTRTKKAGQTRFLGDTLRKIITRMDDIATPEGEEVTNEFYWSLYTKDEAFIKNWTLPTLSKEESSPTSNQKYNGLSKLETLLYLIDTDIDKAFDELDKVFEIKGIYKDLSNEFFSRPNNFSINTFRSKLRRFTKINFPKS